MEKLNAINMSLDDYIKQAGFDKQYNRPKPQEFKNKNINTNNTNNNFFNRNKIFHKRNDNRNKNVTNVVKCYEKYNSMQRNSRIQYPNIMPMGAMAKYTNQPFGRGKSTVVSKQPAVFNMEKKRLTQNNINDFAMNFMNFLDNYENVIHKPVYDLNIHGQLAVLQNKTMQCTNTGVIISTVGHGIDCIIQPTESRTVAFAHRHS